MCWHNASMPIQITIRNVPEEVRDGLAERAAAEHKSMQEFLLERLEAIARRPTAARWLEQVREFKADRSTRIPLQSNASANATKSGLPREQSVFRPKCWRCFQVMRP